MIPAQDVGPEVQLGSCTAVRHRFWLWSLVRHWRTVRLSLFQEVCSGRAARYRYPGRTGWWIAPQELIAAIFILLFRRTRSFAATHIAALPVLAICSGGAQAGSMKPTPELPGMCSTCHLLAPRTRPNTTRPRLSATSRALVIGLSLHASGCRLSTASRSLTRWVSITPY